MYCKECGTKVEDGAKFCPECGKPVEEPVAEQKKVPWYLTTPGRVVIGICGVIILVNGIMSLAGVISRAGSRGEQPPVQTTERRDPEPPPVDKDSKVVASFDANGGDGSMDPLAPDSDGKLKLPACNYYLPGHHFSHWTTSPDAGTGTKSYVPGDTVEVSQPMTFFASWAKASPAAVEAATKVGQTITGTFEDWDADSQKGILIVNNNTDAVLNVNATFSFFDSTGAEKGKSYDDFTAVSPGNSAILVAYDLFDSAAASYSVSCEAPSDWMSPLEGAIKAEVTSHDADETTVEVTNTSQHDVYLFSLRCVATMSSGDQLVGDSYVTATLAPGASCQAKFEKTSMVDYLYGAAVVPDLDQMDITFFASGYESLLEK